MTNKIADAYLVMEKAMISSIIGADAPFTRTRLAHLLEEFRAVAAEASGWVEIDKANK